MRRKTKGFYALKRPKLRASWNKINLYHISRFRSPVKVSDTLYKQKWVSKSASRKYHGETLAEKHWTRIFRPMVRSVVPMNPVALAEDDGRAQSAGRGSGRERQPTEASTTEARKIEGRKHERNKIPYANMVYASLERRLDMAVFRALFASSTRQARQFCIHGFVKVNGQQMVYPGYMLNPGDLFQVDPERVMFATGAGKDSSQRREGRVRRRLAAKGVAVPGKPKKTSEAEAEETADAESAEEPVLDNRATLQRLLETSKTIASNEPRAKANRKRALRDFTRLVRKTLSQTPKASADGPAALPAEATAQLQELMSTLNITVQDASETRSEPASATPSRHSTTTTFTDADEEISDPNKPKPAIPLAQTQTVRSHQRAQLAAALQEARDNPIDATKPYATPWRPRPFMSAFAFVPRYLEVHHAICAAVYLRHPVARPGLAEVPTPFDNELLALAHNWYLRRR